MNVKLGRDGDMFKDITQEKDKLGYCYIEQRCPYQDDGTLCSDWCPKFVIDNEKKTVTIYCGCAPISYNITKDEREKS